MALPVLRVLAAITTPASDISAVKSAAKSWNRLGASSPAIVMSITKPRTKWIWLTLRFTTNVQFLLADFELAREAHFHAPAIQRCFALHVVHVASVGRNRLKRAVQVRRTWR
jgi:hypothetical protein